MSWTIVYDAYGDWSIGESFKMKRDAMAELQKIIGTDVGSRKEKEGFYMINEHAMILTSNLKQCGYDVEKKEEPEVVSSTATVKEDKNFKVTIDKQNSFLTSVKVTHTESGHSAWSSTDGKESSIKDKVDDLKKRLTIHLS